MMGLMVLGFFAVYLLISIWVTSKAASWAKANNKKPWLWGGLAAFMMYNLVFWDWIPTLVAHKYYCSTQAGFWVYKTPEQWMKENPELTKEDLKPYVEGDKGRHIVLYAGTPNAVGVRKINRRIFNAFDIQKIEGLLPIQKQVDYFYDIKTNLRTATLLDITSGYGNPMTTGGILGFKGWLANDGCQNPKVDRINLNQYSQNIVELGER